MYSPYTSTLQFGGNQHLGCSRSGAKYTALFNCFSWSFFVSLSCHGDLQLNRIHLSSMQVAVTGELPSRPSSKCSQARQISGDQPRWIHRVKQQQLHPIMQEGSSPNSLWLERCFGAPPTSAEMIATLYLKRNRNITGKFIIQWHCSTVTIFIIENYWTNW